MAQQSHSGMIRQIFHPILIMVRLKITCFRLNLHHSLIHSRLLCMLRGSYLGLFFSLIRCVVLKYIRCATSSMAHSLKNSPRFSMVKTNNLGEKIKKKKATWVKLQT